MDEEPAPDIVAEEPKDPALANVNAAIAVLVAQRNRAEEQSRHLIRDLWQIAAALRCEPSQSGVMEAIAALQGAYDHAV